MEIPRYWRERKQRYSLVGETCPVCKSRVFPPREVCPVCSEAARESVSVNDGVEQHSVFAMPAQVEVIER